MDGGTNDTCTTLTAVRTWRIQIFFMMLCSRICCSSEQAWICFILKFRKRQKTEFQLLLVLLLPSVIHQRQPRIIEKSSLIQIKLIRVCYSNSVNTGPGSNYFSVKFLNFIVCIFSLCRRYDGKSLIAISKSPLDRQQLGHPRGSKTQSGSVTN